MRAYTLCLVLLFVGCGVSEKIDQFTDTVKKLPSEITGALKRDSDTIAAKLGGGLVRGVRDTLASPATQRDLQGLIDSLVSALGSAASREAPRIVDSILGTYLERRLRDLGDATKDQVAGLRDELLGGNTRERLLVLRDSLLGDGLVSRAAGLRNELLGPTTNAAVRAIVDSAMVSLIQRYKQDLQPEFRKDLGFIKNNAQELLITLGAVAVVIVGYFWWQKRKYQKTLNLLTFQIHEISDQQVYDDLTRQIQRSAQASGLEPLLRKTLTSQGVLGVESWRPPKGKAA